MKILCVADLHMGAGADYGAAPGDRLADQEQVLRQIVALVDLHEIEHVIIAGDVFHRPRPTPAELLVVQRFIDELVVPTTIISGNHDVASAADPNVLELYRRDGVAFYDTPGVIQLHATREWPDVWLALLPWTPPARMYGQLADDRVDAAQTVADRLVAVAAGLRGQIAGPAILALHWSVSGAVTSTGALTDDFREPVLSAAALDAQGWDAIVCGHIHRGQDLGVRPRDADGWPTDWRPFFYCGSPGVVDFGEAAHQHGAWILDVGENEIRETFRPLRDRPFVTIDDLSIDVDEDAIRDAVLRIRYTATAEEARGISHDALRQMALSAGVHKVYAIQPTIIDAARARDERVTDAASPADAVEMWLEQRTDLSDPVRTGVRERSGSYLTRAAS